MKNILIFIGGFIAGIATTIIAGYLITAANKPIDEGIRGLTKFPKKGECISTASTNKSSEIEIFQVIEPNMALGYLKYYSEKKHYDGEPYRDYDFENEIVIMLLNYDGIAFYDDQKIDVTDKCVRRIGTFQYTTKKNKLDKTIPAVIVE